MPMIWQMIWSVVLAAAAASDLRSRRIPDWLILGGLALALARAARQGGAPTAAAVIGGLVALALFGPVYLLSRRQSGDAFGLGDVKLAVLVGVICQWPLAVPALLLGVLAGGLAALAILLWHLALRSVRPGTPMPYAPFLALGGLVAVWAGPQMMTVWTSLGIR